MSSLMNVCFFFLFSFMKFAFLLSMPRNQGKESDFTFSMGNEKSRR